MSVLPQGGPPQPAQPPPDIVTQAGGALPVSLQNRDVVDAHCSVFIIEMSSSAPTFLLNRFLASLKARPGIRIKSPGAPEVGLLSDTPAVPGISGAARGVVLTQLP